MNTGLPIFDGPMFFLKNQTARKQFLQKIDWYATCVRWSAVLLKPELSHTLSTKNWHHKIGHHIAITLLVDGNSMAIFILEEKRPKTVFALTPHQTVTFSS